MIDNNTFEKIFFQYILKNNKYFSKIKSSYFKIDELKILFKITKQFYDRFSESPTKEQLIIIAKSDEFKNQINESLINIIFKENIESYDKEWLEETVKSWILWKSLDSSLIDTIEYVKQVKVTPDNIQQVIGKVKTLINDRNSISFDDNLGKSFFDVNSHITSDDDRITSTYNWIDNLIKGYRRGSLVVYAGMSGVGKSIFLANDAASYVKLGFNVAVITAEMSDTDFVYRIGSNLLNIKINEYENKSKESGYIKNKLNNLSSIIKPGELYIKQYPTSSVTVPEIETNLRELELTSGINFDIIIVDYINILSNVRNPNSENTYMKIKQISEDLRAMAVRGDYVVISATQITRNFFDSTTLDVTGISESAGLIHTADVIMGIIQNPEMYLDNNYWVKLLKIRNGTGKNTKCKYDIAYEYMRLTETTDIMVDDMF